jgi:iron(III) transport system ATP-binding protein
MASRSRRVRAATTGREVTSVSRITIRGLSKRFGGKTPTTAIDALDLEIESGEFLVLLGPSGCGKTTTLRCLAGLETADEGHIAFGDRVVFDASQGVDVPPNKRQIGMVFQSYALWPHMSVRKNIGYPLKTRRVDRATASQWIDEVATLVDCRGLLDRYPAQLSGGQQQRIALARGLVARPDVVLFDEPLSNLDARLRDLVRTEIHELHRRLEFTAVYVTHDQVEALALGDRLAVMRSGALEQLDTPQRTFERPATEYVAGFIGMVNRLMLERVDGAWMHDGAPVEGELPPGVSSSSTLTLRTRAEDVELVPADASPPPGSFGLRAILADNEFGGRHLDLVIELGPVRLQSRMPTGPPGSWVRSLRIGESVNACINASTVAVFDSQGAAVATKTPRVATTT